MQDGELSFGRSESAPALTINGRFDGDAASRKPGAFEFSAFNVVLPFQHLHGSQPLGSTVETAVFTVDDLCECNGCYVPATTNLDVLMQSVSGIEKRRGLQFIYDQAR